MLASATSGFDIAAEPDVVTTIPAANGWGLIILTRLLEAAASYFLGKKKKAILSGKC